MINTIIRFFFCLSLVITTASKRKLDEKDEPACKIARTVGPIPAVSDADNMLATQALITSDIVNYLLEISDFSLAYPFSLVSREYLKVVCGACFRRLQSLPISPSIPTSKAILTFASLHLKMSGLKVDPEVAIDTILRLIDGTDNQQIFIQAITFLSQLEFPESKKKDAIHAVNSLQLKLKPGEISHAFGIDYLRIKYDGFSAFSNVVYVEILHRIRCTQDDKFCRPEHLNRSKQAFFGNIRVFYPEFFEKMHEEIIIMDSLPIMKECTVKFLPFYQEIMGGLIMATPVLSLDSVCERIKADDYDLFWKMCLMQLSALPRWGRVNSLDCVSQDPILTEHFCKIAEILRAFSAPAGFSIKCLSESKSKYVFTCLFAHMHLGVDATDEKVKLIATKAVYTDDFETSIFLVKMLKSAGHYKAAFDAIDAGLAPLHSHICALDLIKNLSGRVLADYITDRRRIPMTPPLLLQKIAGNLNQIVKGNVVMAERYNVVLEYAAGQNPLIARQMACLIIYTVGVVPSLRTDENPRIIVDALSKRGAWIQEAFESFPWERN